MHARTCSIWIDKRVGGNVVAPIYTHVYEVTWRWSREHCLFFSMRVESFHCEYVAVLSFVGYITTRGLRRTRNLLELYDEDGVAVVVFSERGSL